MGQRKSIVRQGVEKLLAMAAFGQSKHQDKKQNGGKPARDKIYASVTMDNYIDSVSRFLRWAQKNYGCRYIEEAEEHVREYLEQRMKTQSPWTVRAECAGISKLYQKSMHSWGVDLPARRRDDIVQHRKDKWIGHFSPQRNADLVSFSLATGLRRRELKAAVPGDVYEEDGVVYVKTVGKGGKFRVVPCLNREPLRIAQAAAAAGKTKIFDHVPKYTPAHMYRAQYAQIMYAQLARPLEEIPKDERYICRGTKKGIVYDRLALIQTSKALGHNRCDVIANNYLYKADKTRRLTEHFPEGQQAPDQDVPS